MVTEEKKHRHSVMNSWSDKVTSTIVEDGNTIRYDYRIVIRKLMVTEEKRNIDKKRQFSLFVIEVCADFDEIFLEFRRIF